MLKLLCELLKLHELLETLVNSEAEVFANKGYVDVFLVSFDNRVEACRGLVSLVRMVHFDSRLL